MAGPRMSVVLQSSLTDSHGEAQGRFEGSQRYMVHDAHEHGTKEKG